MGTYDLVHGGPRSPDVHDDPPCDLCGRDPGADRFGCICVPCPECGVAGRRECLDEHALVPVIGRYPDPCPYCGLQAEPKAPKAYNLRVRWSAEHGQILMHCSMCGHEMTVNTNKHVFWNRGTPYSRGEPPF